MTSSILLKEQEYRKLNEEVQNVNKKLMEEFNIKKQDTLLKECARENAKPEYATLQEISYDKSTLHHKNNVSFHTSRNRKSHSLSTKENCGDYLNDNNKIELKQVPDSVDQMGVRGMTQFYRAKIKAMQNEYDALHLEHKNKCEEMKKIQKEVTKIAEEKEKWFQAYNTNKNNIGKLETQISSLNSKSNAKETENVSLRKELEQVKKDFKSININVSGSEVKLNRALEENEKMKSSLKIAKQEEKDLKEAHRKEITEITTALRRSEKHKAELLAGFKRQMQLIDNLKKQKACLETSKLTQISENEFAKILNWKLEV